MKNSKTNPAAETNLNTKTACPGPNVSDKKQGVCLNASGIKNFVI